MRSEKEIKDKIKSLIHMRRNAENTPSPITDELVNNLDYQIDMLLWVVEAEGGLCPLDEETMYERYW